MSKEELNVFQKSFCTSARNTYGKLSVYKKFIKWMKSIWEPPLIISFAGYSLTNRFPLSLTLLLLRQIHVKHKSICNWRPQKNRQHCRPYRAHKKRSETNFQRTDKETVRLQWAQTGREQKCRKTTGDDLVLPQSLFWPTRTRDSMPANANNSVLSKNPSRSWIFWWAEPKRWLESFPATKNYQDLRDSEDESDAKIFSVPDSELASNHLHISSSNWCEGTHSKGRLIEFLSRMILTQCLTNGDDQSFLQYFYNCYVQVHN